MTADWAIYDNTNWQFRVKYPKDLTPKEGTYDSSTDEVLFESPSALAFSIWIKQGGDLDNTLKLMIANQCSSSITMSDVVIGSIDFRKALDIPDKTCLNQLGVPDFQLAAYGFEFKPNTYLMLRDDDLNDEQLEAVIGSIEFY
jgi:hypothetical protein